MTNALELSLPQRTLKAMIEKTQFAMASSEDARQCLNGLLLDCVDGELRAVASDGYRLAYACTKVATSTTAQAIVPRKGVQELTRLLATNNKPAQVRIDTNHIQVVIGDACFASDLIDNRLPNYQQWITASTTARVVLANRLALHAALKVVTALPNNTYRGVRLSINSTTLRVQTCNREQQVSEKEVEIDYSGAAFEIGFNVAYLLDALGALDGELVELSFDGANPSCLLLQNPYNEGCRHVVMPMRL